MSHRKPFRVVLLYDYNVVASEHITQSAFKAHLMGWIWRYVPDLTFHRRRYMVVDNHVSP